MPGGNLEFLLGFGSEARGVRDAPPKCLAGLGTQMRFRSPRPPRGGQLSVGSGPPYAPAIVCDDATEELPPAHHRPTTDQPPPRSEPVSAAPHVRRINPTSATGPGPRPGRPGSLHVSRQGYEFFETAPVAPGGLDFGGQPGPDAPADRLLSVRAGGMYPVPPVRDASPCLPDEVFG
ncbi:hypothetical protein [Streptomyces sp. SJL17-1]|uniref:hypothetical protein n=1 Tax=Streptomyces sp. SJL17-1 TaxID=2967223 RepID=UPI00296632F4|nr:hypothetical protein [Streptomyces sp. SJL17-1]